MKLLDILNNKLIISPEALGLSFFKEIWFKDKSTDKSKATNDIKYVYYYSDFSSPYFIYPELDRVNYIKEYVVGNDYKVSKEVLKAIECYRELTITPAMRLLEAANVAISKTKDYLNGVDYTKMDDNGRFIYDIDKVSKLIINMPKMQEALNQAKDICLKEQSSTTKVRGGKDVSLFED